MTQNIEWKIDGNKLIVTMEISYQSMDTAPASASGKTFEIASNGSAAPLASSEVKPLTRALNPMPNKQLLRSCARVTGSLSRSACCSA